MSEDFGTATHKHKTYQLTDQAVISNRSFPGFWFDAQQGEAYTAEYHANAIGPDGCNYLVYWQFDTVKGEEPGDESDYPWDDAHITNVEVQ